MDIVLFFLLASLFVSFIALSIYLIRRWGGIWRLAAVLPSMVLAGVTANILIGTLYERTSHNLWPLEIVVWSAGGLVFLGVMTLAHKLKK